MDYATHSVTGILITSAIAYVSIELGSEVNSLALIGGGLIGSLLPDIDCPKSFIGRRTKLLSELLYNTIGHRTFTHSLPFTIVTMLIVGAVNRQFAAGIGLGILSHIFLDMFNGKGVAYLYPVIKNRIKWFKLIP